MKSLYSCFGILLWSLQASRSNSLTNARRTFTLLNALNNYQDNVGPYGAQHYSGNLVDPFYETLIRGSTYPTSMEVGSSLGGNYYKLETTVDELVKIISELKSQKSVCNPLMPPGSLVIGSVCYYVSSTPASFANALQTCRSYGGTLAEPTPGFSNPLWGALLNAFPLQMATILGPGAEQLWIGGQALPNSNIFTYVSTGNNIVPSPTFNPVLGTPPAYARGVLMQASGHPWDADNQAESYPYLCWSTTLSPAGSRPTKPYKTFRSYPDSSDS